MESGLGARQRGILKREGNTASGGALTGYRDWEEFHICLGSLLSIDWGDTYEEKPKGEQKARHLPSQALVSYFLNCVRGVRRGL